MTDDPDINNFLEYSARMIRMTNFGIETIRESFRRGFAKSLSGQVTPREYEKETGWEFDTTEEFQEHLKELWVKLYGAADPEDSLV